MPLPLRAVSRVLVTLFLAVGTGACAQDPGAMPTPQAARSGCLESGDGALQAELRGAMQVDLAWRNDQMECEGGPRPGGGGIRVMIAGPVTATAGAAAGQLRFIFGIDLHDTASGIAQALPTNLTVIAAGGQQLYATRGDDKCAVETLQRTPLSSSGGKVERVKVRGYCTGPASDLSDSTRLLVPTFSFTALVRNGDEP